MNELLSISIPTRNRPKYLKELLQSIEKQVAVDNNIYNFIKIYVFDNASSSDTFEVVKMSGLAIIYKKNNQNIGGELNVCQAYTAVQGKYVWVIGDDELIPENTINFILQLINTYHPHLIINIRGYKAFVELPLTFSSYSEFAFFAQAHNPHILIAHSLISANIILKRCFDADFALQQIHTHYGQFYGMIKGLKNSPGKILIPKKKTIIVRDRRAEPCDPVAPIDGRYPETIDNIQVRYLEWLSREYGLKNLVPQDVVPDYMWRVFFYEIKTQPIPAILHMLFYLYGTIYNSYPSSRHILFRIKSLYFRVIKRVI